MSDIENTIKERTKTCGEFRDITKTSYDLKYILRQGDKFPRIPPYMVEAMDMMLFQKVNALFESACRFACSCLSDIAVEIATDKRRIMPYVLFIVLQRIEKNLRI